MTDHEEYKALCRTLEKLDGEVSHLFPFMVHSGGRGEGKDRKLALFAWPAEKEPYTISTWRTVDEHLAYMAGLRKGAKLALQRAAAELGHMVADIEKASRL